MIWGIISGVIIRQETLQFEIYVFWRFLIGRNEQSQFHKKSQIVITISQHNTIFFQAYFTTLVFDIIERKNFHPSSRCIRTCQ